MRARYVVVPVVLASALALAACGSESSEQKQGGTPSVQGTQQLKGPKVGVTIVRPKPGDTADDDVTAKVSLRGFTLDSASFGEAPEPGTGHLHFSLDKGKFDYPPYAGRNARLGRKLGVNGKYSEALEPRITYRNLPKGKHTLEVILANNDHSSAGPRATTSFTVK